MNQALLSMTLSGPRLTLASVKDPRWEDLYSVSSLLQLSPTQAGLVSIRHALGHKKVDFENGADLLVFDDLRKIAPAAAIPLVRTEEVVHPETGVRVFMIAYLCTGGFVPLGARLDNGTPHPAAGTGFLLGVTIATPVADAPEQTAPEFDGASRALLLQLRFDGTRMQVSKKEILPREAVLPGHLFRGHPVANTIPDGPDLLSGIVMGPVERDALGRGLAIPSSHPHAEKTLGRNVGSGMLRWRFMDGAWRPAAFTPVTPADLSGEPSLIRAGDGSLLFSVRGKGSNAAPGQVQDGIENTYCHFRVWRSTDGGKNWLRVIHLPEQRAPSPVVLNRTVGGRPFLAANPFHPLGERGSDGKLIYAAKFRENLWLWPLTEDYCGVREPVCALDAKARFGAPPETPGMPYRNLWYLDHPIGAVCRLADKQWHSLVAFRVIHSGAVSHGGGIDGNCGAWVEEVAAAGLEPVCPPWNFST